jgi:hypothetical protein
MSVVNKYPMGVFNTQMGLQEKNTPPVPGCRYQCDCLVCRRGRCLWRPRPMSGDKDGTNNNVCGNKE